MEENKTLQAIYEGHINKFLYAFIFDMYKGHDYIVARKYFRDLFNELIPKYFCICDNDKSNFESMVN